MQEHICTHIECLYINWLNALFVNGCISICSALYRMNAFSCFYIGFVTKLRHTCMSVCCHLVNNKYIAVRFCRMIMTSRFPNRIYIRMWNNEENTGHRTLLAFKHYGCFYQSGLFELNHAADSIQVLCVQIFISHCDYQKTTTLYNQTYM